MSDYSPIQPIAYVMDDQYLPAAVRPLAATWRALDERADDVELKLAETRGAKKEAAHADARAATEAVKAGKPVPIPHDKNERENEAATRSAVIESGLVLQEKVKAGEKLLAALIEHRDEIATLATARVTKAMETYTEALDAAEVTLTTARANLGQATEGLGLLFDLAVEPKHRYEVAAPQHTLAAPDLSKARMDLNMIQLDLVQLAKPSNRLAVRTTEGRVIVFPFAEGVQLIRELGGTYVDPADVPADALHTGV